MSLCYMLCYIDDKAIPKYQCIVMLLHNPFFVLWYEKSGFHDKKLEEHNEEMKGK